MYAVIETGGKQYRVEVGTELEVELLDAEPGKTITIDRVLLVADGDDSTIGRPLVADASVSAEIVTQTRGPKLISFKYRPKARSRVKKGHRQELTLLRVADITLGGKSAAKSARKAEEQAKTERQRTEEAAIAQAAKDAELAAKLAVGSEAPAPAKKTTKAKAKAETTRRDRIGRGRQGGRRGQADEGEGRQGRRDGRTRGDDRGRGRDGRRREGRGQERGTEEEHREGSRRRTRRRCGCRPEADPHHEEGRVDEMAHKKAGGSVKNGRDSVGQRLGVKAGDGQLVNAGSIIVRQRGMTFLAGPGTGLGHDYTVFATVTGKVKFEHATKAKKRIRVEAVDATAPSA